MGITWDDEKPASGASGNGIVWDTPSQSKGWYQDYVAPALNTVLGGLMEGAAGPGGPQGSLRSLPTPAAGAPWVSPEAKEAAAFVVPQTAAQAGGQLGATIGALSGAGIVPVTGLGILGAILGSKSEGGDVLSPDVAGTAIGVGAGEVGGRVLPWMLRSIPGAERRIANQDAARIFQAATDLAPGLGREGAQSATATSASERLRDLAAQGLGRQGLSDAKEEIISRIEAATGGMIPTPPSLHTANPANYGPAGTAMSLRDANAELTAIGEGLRHADIVDPTLKHKAIQRDYGTLVDEIRQALDTVSPGLGDVFQGSQVDTRSGIALLGKRQLASTQAWRPGSQGPELNSVYLQEILKDPKIELQLRQKLGDEGFQQWADAVTRGAGVGNVDKLPGVETSADVLNRFGRTGRVLNLPMEALRTLLPNLGASYVGAKPYSLTPELQALLDILLQRSATKGLDALNQPIPIGSIPR